MFVEFPPLHRCVLPIVCADSSVNGSGTPIRLDDGDSWKGKFYRSCTAAPKLFESALTAQPDLVHASGVASEFPGTQNLFDASPESVQSTLRTFAWGSANRVTDGRFAR